MGRLWERIYPWVISIVVLVGFCFIDFRPYYKGFEKVLDGVITFSSIILGFLAALLAIILSIAKAKVMKHLYSYADGNQGMTVLVSYFRQTIIIGFVLVLLSIWMYVLKEITPFPKYGVYIYFAWVFIVSLFLFSSYRIIEILMVTLNKNSQPETPKTPQKDLMSEQELEKFKGESARNH